MPFHTAPSLSHWLPASLSPLPHSLVVVSSTLCCLSPTPSLALSEAASEVSDTLQHSQRHRFSDAPPQQLFATVGFPLESVLLLLRNNLFFFFPTRKEKYRSALGFYAWKLVSAQLHLRMAVPRLLGRCVRTYESLSGHQERDKK